MVRLDRAITSRASDAGMSHARESSVQCSQKREAPPPSTAPRGPTQLRGAEPCGPSAKARGPRARKAEIERRIEAVGRGESASFPVTRRKPAPEKPSPDLMRLPFQADAVDELENAAAWHERERQGSLFAAEVLRAVERACVVPHSGPRVPATSGAPGLRGFALRPSAEETASNTRSMRPRF